MNTIESTKYQNDSPKHFSALLAEPAYRNKKLIDFCNLRRAGEDIDEEHQENFNIFFERFVPCTSGRKCFTKKDMVGSRISESGKVTVADEAFTEIALRNYWDKWTKNNRPAKWTNSRGGNTAFKGWRQMGYEQFDMACQTVKNARDHGMNETLEAGFMMYAYKKFGVGGSAKKRKRTDDSGGDDIFNELD